VNWLRLEDTATKSELRVVNTHLDHISQIAREQQARLIVEDTSVYQPDYAQILTGDMNCVALNKAIGILKAGGWQDTYAAIHGTENPGNTYHGFLGPGFEPEIGKIDWIFARGKLHVIDAQVIQDTHNGRYPSDHYFVSTEVSL
jgi:endonuclease/exonuclease/phosphatase family metal-dependent hydrolase